MKGLRFTKCFMVCFALMYFSVASFCQQRNNFTINQPASVSEDISLLILCPFQWIDEVQPLADWKNQSGTTTVIVNVTPFANDAVLLKNYIYSYYLQHPLTHVLIIGDHDRVATPFSVTTGAPSDPSYGYLSGNDSYPEVFTGRFPAENDSDVITMVQRTLQYEQSPDTTSDWFSKAAGIASNLGPGDDNEMDWEHLVNIRNQLLNYTYTNVAELYDGTHSSTTDNPGNPSTGDVTTVLNSGISLLNYAGHGQNNSFNTSGFSVNEILQLNNVNRLPVVLAAGCTNGNFTNGSICMGEAFLRARRNGQPIGAVAAFMSAVNQFWNPPMDAQDAMNSIITFNDSIQASTTVGGIMFGGCRQMMDHYGSNGALMTDSWHCFGDPSLVMRTKFPEAVSIIHPLTIYTGDTLFSIASLNEHANITLWQNGMIIGKGKVLNGNCDLICSPVISTDSVLLTVSGYNLYPYQIYIPVLPSPNAVLSASIQFIDDSNYNNNGLADFGETVGISLILENSGLTDFNSLHMNVYSSDPDVLISNITTDTINLPALDTLSVNNAFQLLVSDSVFDGRDVVIYIDATDSSGNLKTFSFTLKLNAPKLLLSSFIIDDSSGNGNGVGEANESVILKLKVINAGGSHSGICFGSLTSLSADLNLLNDSISFQLNANSDTVLYFPAQISSNAILNQLVSLNAVVSSGIYTDDSVYTLTTGYVTDDFESGSFNTFNWQSVGNTPWFISTVQPFEGVFSAQSGDINDNEISVLKIQINVIRKDSLAFNYRTDCEAVWDEFDLQVDSISFHKASGSSTWKHFACMLDTGVHQIQYIYKKDNVFSAGADAVWIDEVRFPPSSIVQSIHAVIEESSLLLFPNPASEFIQFNTDDRDMLIRIFDSSGRQCYEGDTESTAINVSVFPDGIYLLLMQDGKKLFKSQFVVKH